MSRQFFHFLVVFIIISVSANGQGFGDAQKVTDWYFHLGDVHLGGRQTLDHTKWQNVRVPHDWTVEQYASPDLASCTGYLPGGIGWYRTAIDIPEIDQGKRKYLYFEGVYNNSEVYINGNWLGKRPNGYVSFMYDITPYVKPGGKNVVAVRVDHSQDADSRWYTGSGIYRDVHLVTAEQVHIAQWGNYFTAEVKGNSANVSLETTIENHQSNSVKATVTAELRDENGRLVASSKKLVTVPASGQGISTQAMIVKNPKLWGVDNPYLYTLNTRVVVSGKQVDDNQMKVGIRKLTYDPDQGFALNDQWMNIKGVCLHHDAGVLGAAVPKAVWRLRVEKLKEIGVNGIRMSHNPQSTALYEICDELGMLVMDEAFDEWEYPKKKWIEGWNRGKPGFQGAADYFREWGARDLEAMVKRDRNHPSIIMWSIGNEVDYPNDPYSHPVLDSEGIGQIHTSGYQTDQPHAERLGNIATELAAIVRANDESRPVTAALAGAVMSNETDYPGALDIVGYNYTESRYDMDHEKYPERVLYGSETRHDMNAWKAVRDKDFIFGQFIWTGFDYLGEAGAWPSRGFTTGMIDQAGNIKSRGYFRQSLWSDEPMAYVGAYRVPTGRWRNHLSIDAPHEWNYGDGEMVRVVTYTNGDEAELLLNGKLVGERKPYDDESGIIYWDIPYAAGKVQVIAYKDKKRYAEDVLMTSKQPRSLRAEVISKPLQQSGDLALIKLELVDENGNLSYLADNMISCRVEGAGERIGMENASHDAREDFHSWKLRAKNGKLLIYVQATEDTGNITVKLDSDYLESTELKLEIAP